MTTKPFEINRLIGAACLHSEASTLHGQSYGNTLPLPICKATEPKFKQAGNAQQAGDLQSGETIDGISIAICVGCGCHDARACAPGCWWLRVDYAAGAGVCSQCECHVQRWDASDGNWGASVFRRYPAIGVQQKNHPRPRPPPGTVSAPMSGATNAWARYGSAVAHLRYAALQPAGGRNRCQCGCGQRATHLGMANGVCLTNGCALSIRRWVRDGK